MEIIPAVLAESAQDFERKTQSPLMQLTPWIHIDVMDGSFTRQSCISHPGLLPPDFKPSVELHLMVNDPLPYLEEWITNPQFKRAIVHIEAPCDHMRVHLFAKEHQKELALAISPTTPLDTLESFISKVNRILVMGVTPGASGQAFLGEEIFERVSTLRNKYPSHAIAVDGGVTAALIPQLKNTHIQTACTSSAIWNTGQDPVTAYKRISYL